MADNGILKFIRTHPLACVMVVAVLLRLASVMYAKGYMASDDHFETIGIAYGWLQSGPLNDDGHLIWHNHPSSEIARFPLYTLFLYGIMKLYLAAGISSLDSMMYGIRAVHALLSLLSVWALFRITQIVTRADRWALIAGLVGAAHFAMPYLAVRNLIEMVGGHFWIVSLLFIFLFYRDRKQTRLLWAGIFSGLAWMIRFQVAIAALPVPFVLWWQLRSLRPAMVYLAGVAVMVLIAGVVDMILLGPFLGSMLNNVIQAANEGVLYRTSPFIYPAIVLALLIPPFSLLIVYVAARKKFWNQQLMLTATILATIIIHTLMANRQERFMIIILPEVLLYAVLAVAYHAQLGGVLSVHQWISKWIIAPSVAINMVLLSILTVNYTHKEVVEPLVKISQDALPPDEMGTPDVLFVSLGRSRMYPLAYSGLELVGRSFIYQWSHFATVNAIAGDSVQYEYAVVYAEDSTDLADMRDSITAYFGDMVLWRRIRPSPVGWLLHKMNPKHNPGDEAWVLRREP